MPEVYTIEDARREIALLQASAASALAVASQTRESLDEIQEELGDLREMRAKLEGGWRVVMWLGAATLGLSALFYNVLSWTGIRWVIGK